MMKGLSILIVALLATSAFSDFIPVPDYSLAQIQGGWNVQSVYDTAGNDWSLAYCFQLEFDVINSTTVNLTSTFFDGNSNEYRSDSVILYPDNENAAIMYQDADHQLAPLLVLNVSALPYWVDTSSTTTIVAFNYTTDYTNPQYIIFGLSRWYDTSYDIRPFLNQEHLPLNYTHNFWFVNSACDTHYNWNALKAFNASNIQNKTYNLIAVYEPAGTDLVPWYTNGSGIYDWQSAYCASVSFVPGEGYDDLMTLSLKSLYGGTFQRTWQILPASSLEAVLLGFDIDGNTLLYVEYADVAGNIILTAGTTTSFFLSTSATTLTPVLKAAFETALAAIGWTFNVNLINPIDNSSC